MFRVFNRMKLTHKLVLPSMLLLLVVLATGFAYFRLRETVSSAESHNMELSEASATFQDATQAIHGFIEGSTVHEALAEFRTKESQHDMSEEDTARFRVLWSAIDQFDTVRKANDELAAKIDEMTEGSAEISNGYIEAVSKKLADLKTREEVTPLECMVIIGARNNTVANANVQKLFRDVRMGKATGEALIGYIDTLMANAENDRKQLKGTPFIGMVESAIDLNVKIKTMVQTFLANTVKQHQTRETIDAQLADIALHQSQELVASSTKIFTEIRGEVAFALGCLIVVTIVIITVNVLMAKRISRPILGAVSKLSDVALQGNLSEDVDPSLKDRQDELGELFRAIQSVVEFQRGEVHVANLMAQGDWTIEVPLRSDKDDLGRAIGSMATGVRRALLQVARTGDQIHRSTETVSSASHKLSTAAHEQAANLQEISSVITDLNSRTVRNAENAGEAKTLADDARHAASSGTERMNEMIDAMSAINEASEQIVHVIKVIDDIAFQTNLLALNAAVEAARAGQHGKGFAVVAEEVRNLAGRSAKAARETAELIESSTSRVGKGTELASQTSDALQGIAKTVGEVHGLITNIAQASEEQAVSVGQVETTLGQIDQGIQQNASHAEETATESSALDGQASQLQTLLQSFKLGDRLSAAIEDERQLRLEQTIELAEEASRLV